MKVHEEHKKKGPEVINVVLIIVSTSRFNELREGDQSTDKTIPLIRGILNENEKISLNATEIVADDKNLIEETLVRYD